MSQLDSNGFYLLKDQTTHALRQDQLAKQKKKTLALNKIPLFGQWHPKIQTKVGNILAFISIIITTLMMVASVYFTEANSTRLISVEQLQSDAIRIAFASMRAANGHEDSFSNFVSLRTNIDRVAQELQDSKKMWGFESDVEATQLSALVSLDSHLITETADFQYSKDRIVKANARYHGYIPLLQDWNLRLGLLQLYLTQTNAPLTARLRAAQTQYSVQQMLMRLQYLVSSSPSSDTPLLRVSIDGLLQNMEVLQLYIPKGVPSDLLQAPFNIQKSLDALIQDEATILTGKDRVQKLSVVADDLHAAARNLTATYTTLGRAKLMILWCVTALSFILTVFMGWFIAWLKAIHEKTTQYENEESLHLFNQAMVELADGNLRSRLSVPDNALIYSLSDAYNKVVEDLNLALDTVKHSASHISVTSDKMSEIHGDIHISVNEQTRNTKEAVRLFGDLKVLSKSILDLVRTTETAAASAALNAEAGANAAKDSTTAMNALSATMNAANKQVKRLAESAQKAAAIVDFIGDLTERTQILALNASLIAAQASDHRTKGDHHDKGVRVIATEVENLASTSKVQLMDIQGLIKNIAEEMQVTITTMDTAITNVLDGKQTAEDSERILKDVSISAKEQVSALRTITKHANEQQANAALGNETGLKIQEITETLLQSLGQFDSHVTAMRDTSGLLTKTVKQRFKLANDKE